MDYKIVTLAGQYASGKDVVADYLCNRLNKITGETWRRDALANNVKKTFQNAFRVDREFLEKWKRVNDIPPGFSLPIRKALTIIGDGFRDIQGDVWIKSLMSSIESNVCLSDVRYINEAVYFEKENGTNILMWRPGYENDFPSRSEQELMTFVNLLKNKPDGEITDDMPFHYWLKNDGTLDDIYQKIDDSVIPFVLDHL